MSYRVVLATALVAATACEGPLKVPDASRIGFITQPSSAVSGAPIEQVKVAFLTADGLVVANESRIIQVSLQATNGAQLTGVTSQMAFYGVATFAGLSIEKAGTGYRLVAKTAGFDSTVSEPFDITAAFGAATGAGVSRGRTPAPVRAIRAGDARAPSP